MKNKLRERAKIDLQKYFEATGINKMFCIKRFFIKRKLINSLYKFYKKLDKGSDILDKVAGFYPFADNKELLNKWNLKDPRHTDGSFELIFKKSS